MIRSLVWVGLVAAIAGCADAPRGREQGLTGIGEAGESAGGSSGETRAEAGANSVAGSRSSAEHDAGAAGESFSEPEAGAFGDATGEGGSANTDSGGAPQGGAATHEGGAHNVAGAGGRATGGAAGAATSAAGSSSGGAGAGGATNCTCSAGECCDGCHPLPSTHLCASNQVRSTHCPTTGPSHNISTQYADLYCDGVESDACTLWVDTTYVSSTCPTLNDVCHNPLNGIPYCGPQ